MTQSTGQQRVPLSRLQLSHPVSLQVFDDYEHAQRSVDYLSDREFPVENVMIVGTDLKQVERITGRLTSGRVLASGALSGAWMGMFFGSLMWLFVQGGGIATFVTAVIVGALFGMIWAALAYRYTGGARDFTSVTQVVATRYELLVEHHLIGDSRRLLDEMRRGVPKDAGPLAAQAGTPQAGQGGSAWPGGSDGSGLQNETRPWGSGQQWGAPGPAGPPAAPYGGASIGAPGGDGKQPPAPVQPRYRTYGEALDAERASREVGSAPRSDSRRESGSPDDSAAEDAHDAPGGAHSAPAGSTSTPPVDSRP